MAVPGVGARMMGALLVIDRVRLRRTCRFFLPAVDDSLQRLTQLFFEVSDKGGCPAACTAGLPWLLTKCPNLQTLSVHAVRTSNEVVASLAVAQPNVVCAHQPPPWCERNDLSCRWQWAVFSWVPAGQPHGVRSGPRPQLPGTCQPERCPLLRRDEYQIASPCTILLQPARAGRVRVPRRGRRGHWRSGPRLPWPAPADGFELPRRA
eukprot:jgi/Mesvir1/17719/Mv16612-RA.1